MEIVDEPIALSLGTIPPSHLSYITSTVQRLQRLSPRYQLIMVQWGDNTTFTFNSSNPPGTPATTAAPTTGAFSFGGATNSSTPTAPSPSGFSSFGANPSAGGLFGGNGPAPSGGFFGNTSTAPAFSSGGLFSFNTGTPTGPQQQQQLQLPQIPAQAALQAHINVTAQNEQNRVLTKLQKINDAYHSGSVVGDDPESKSHCFSTVSVFNPATSQEIQFQTALLQSTGGGSGSGGGANYIPAKPPQISETDWRLACVRAPSGYVPVALVGAEQLAARVVSHQEHITVQEKEMSTLQATAMILEQRMVTTRRQVKVLAQRNQELLHRLLHIVKHVEVARCFNVSLQPAELDALKRIRHLKNVVLEGTVAPAVMQLMEDANQTCVHYNQQPMLQQHDMGLQQELPSEEVQQQWMHIMKEHRSKLTHHTTMMQKDHHELQLIRDRVQATDATVKKYVTGL